MGVVTPQGWLGEFAGWDPRDAWRRTAEVALEAERLGFESVWLFDHFHTHPEPTDELTFESFTALAALATLTTRVRLGHLVVCTGYRNPAVTAKMIATMDVISGGRMELGIGAGWKRDEWEAYGFGFPATRDRLGRLRDDLEIVTRLLHGDRNDRAAYRGAWSSVDGAISLPRPVQSHLPIMVGGNGRNVTWRLAAEYADELNVDGLTPAELAAALPVIRDRCESAGRDPATLRISAHLWNEWLSEGPQRVELIAGYRELGISRVMGFVATSAASDDVLELLAADARAAGVEMA